MDEDYKRRVKAIACALVAGMLERGEIAETEDAIRAATKRAVADAKQVVRAAEEYICG